jgi:predicted nucleic acid-binding protein
MSGPLVCVDASVVVALVSPETLSDQAEKLWRSLTKQKAQALAPSLLIYEVTSALRRKAARSLISAKDAQEALIKALSLDILFVDSPKLAIAAFKLASRFNRLAAYDMFYLALAEKVSEFWTADQHLYNACVQQGWSTVRWLGNMS